MGKYLALGFLGGICLGIALVLTFPDLLTSGRSVWTVGTLIPLILGTIGASAGIIIYKTIPH